MNKHDSGQRDSGYFNNRYQWATFEGAKTDLHKKEMLEYENKLTIMAKS